MDCCGFFFRFQFSEWQMIGMRQSLSRQQLKRNEKIWCAAVLFISMENTTKKNKAEQTWTNRPILWKIHLMWKENETKEERCPGQYWNKMIHGFFTHACMNVDMFVVNFKWDRKSEPSAQQFHYFWLEDAHQKCDGSLVCICCRIKETYFLSSFCGSLTHWKVHIFWLEIVCHTRSTMSTTINWCPLTIFGQMIKFDNMNTLSLSIIYRISTCHHTTRHLTANDISMSVL